MLQDLKTSTGDKIKMELQGRVDAAEEWIQHYKGRVSEWESEATGYEERLGLLKKEGECSIPVYGYSCCC